MFISLLWSLFFSQESWICKLYCRSLWGPFLLWTENLCFSLPESKFNTIICIMHFERYKHWRFITIHGEIRQKQYLTIEDRKQLRQPFKCNLKVENYRLQAFSWKSVCFFSCQVKSWLTSPALQSYPWALWRTVNKYYCLFCTSKEKPVLIATIDVQISSGVGGGGGNSCSIMGK